MANYILNDHDLDTLDALIQQAIKDARNDTTVSDDVLAHYYALKAKLSRILEGRAEKSDDEPKPKKARKARKIPANTFNALNSEA